MKIKRGISLAVCLALALALLMPQYSLAAADAEHTYPFTTGVLPYSAQMEDETSVRLTWHGFTPCKGYLITWERSDGSGKTESVKLDQAEITTYVVKGLEKDTDYRFTVSGILIAADGGDMFTQPVEIEGSTYIHTPEYSACRTGSTWIISYWHVKEKRSLLNIYRADTKNGEYRLVDTLEAGGNSDYGDHGRSDGDTQYVSFGYDENVSPQDDHKAGRTYYYKAQAEAEINGKTYVSQMSDPVALQAKNEGGIFKTTLLNKKKTYTRQIKFKLTSDVGNYTAYLKGFSSLRYRNKKGVDQKRKVSKMEYSRDGKKYYTLKNKNVKLKPGETIYLRVNTTGRYWISSKADEGELVLNAKYLRPAYAGKSDNVKLYIKDFNSRFGGAIPALEEDERDPAPSWFSKLFYRTVSADDDPEPTVQKAGDTSVLVNWRSLKPYISMSYAGYALRYGTTKESVTPSQGEPLLFSKYQTQALIENLDPEKTYYFTVVVFTDPGNNGSERDARYRIVKWDGNKATVEEVGYM